MLIHYKKNEAYDKIRSDLFDIVYNDKKYLYALPLWCMFYYDGLPDIKFLSFDSPDNLADTIYYILKSFGNDRGWNASIHITENGVFHIFFSDKDDIEIPELVTQPIIGNA